LELSLYNCKQNIQIDSIILQFHREILAASKRCKEANRPLKSEELGKLLESEDFISALQAGANVWIRDIQKVSKMERFVVICELLIVKTLFIYLFTFCLFFVLY
jgi:hypothetical protein